MTDDTPAEQESAAESERPTRADLERELLGDEPSLTVREVAADEDTQAAARLWWRALGFPDPGSDEAVFTPRDKHAMVTISGLVGSGHIDFETATKLARAIGQTMARLADWQVATLTEYIEGIEERGHGTGSRLRTGMGLIRELEPPFEELMMYAWRRHLAAAFNRIEALGAQDSDLHTVTVTVGFADLVSFTQLANGVDEDELADLVEDFESLCADIITGRGGRVIKTLGDSVLFIAGGPLRACDIACDIVEQVGGDRRLPDVHVGLATGPVVMRLGDVFGPPVNLASRLTGVARRNRVICDEKTAAVAREAGFATRPLTARPMRGFGTVQPIALRRVG